MNILHTHTDFVCAAYAVTGLALFGIVFQSTLRYLKLTKTLKTLHPE